MNPASDSGRSPLGMRSPLVVFCIALAVHGCVARPNKPHPTDAELLAYFHQHRADLDRLRENDQARARLGPDSVDIAAFQDWSRLIRRLGLPGGGSIESANRIFIPVHSRSVGADSVDVKGFAWIDSVGTQGARIDTLRELDSLDPRAPGSAGRHVRHVDSNWYLYRSIGLAIRD